MTGVDGMHRILDLRPFARCDFVAVACRVTHAARCSRVFRTGCFLFDRRPMERRLIHA